MGTGQVFSGGEDILAWQTSVTSAGTVGPFGTDPHLAFPTGMNPWSYPQLGIALLTAAWLLAGPFGIPSGMAALIIMIASLVATALATVYFLRSFVDDRLKWLTTTLAAALALSPFFAIKVGHINIALFFMVPLILGILVRGVKRERRWRIWAVGVIFIATAISPLWWVTVMLLFIPVIGVAALLQRKLRLLGWIVSVFTGIAAGTGVQLLLYHHVAIPGANLDRSVWSANLYGGRLTDTVLASPLINQIYPPGFFNLLRSGGSVEFKPVGLVCLAMMVILILLLIKLLPRYIANPATGSGATDGKAKRIDTNLLAIMSIVSILFYLSGGLGNAQATAAVMLGGQSPARAFSRFTIIMAMFGMAWLLLYLSRDFGTRIATRRPARITYIAAAIAVAVVATVDLSALPHAAVAAENTLSEYPAIDFLRAHTKPCPVAQLPQEGAPVPRAIPTAINDREQAQIDEQLYYRGYYAYLIAPDYYWSIGSYVPAKPTAINQLGKTFDAAGLASLQKAGFCAVMYDKVLAASPRGGALEGAKRAADLPAAGFTSERYDMYLLNQ